MFSPPKCSPFEQNCFDDHSPLLNYILEPNELQLIKSQSLLCAEDDMPSPYLQPRNLQRFNSEVFRDFSGVVNVQIGENNRFLKDSKHIQNRNKQLMGDFEIIQLIGKGSMGRVFKVRSKVDGLFYAAKRVSLERNIEPLIHKGLVRFNGCYQHNGYLYVIVSMGYIYDQQMEHCEYSLKQRLSQRVYESEIRQILFDICEILSQLGSSHDHIHGGNILFSKQMKYKLSDYQFSQTITHHQGPEKENSRQNDIYSLGLLLMELMLEKEIVNPTQLYLQKLDNLSYYSMSLKQQIKKMVSYNPMERPDYFQLMKFAQVEIDLELQMLRHQNQELQKQINCQIINKRRKSD